MLIEISALVISGIVDNQSPNNRVMGLNLIKVMPDAYYKLSILLLKCTIQNLIVLWVIAQIHFHLCEVQIFLKQPTLTILNYSRTLLMRLLGHKNLTTYTLFQNGSQFIILLFTW